MVISFDEFEAECGNRLRSIGCDNAQGLDFVFLDSAGRPYYCRRWGDELWLFYWHKSQQSWVSLRQTIGNEASLFPHNLSSSEQQQYHDLHAEGTRKRNWALTNE